MSFVKKNRPSFLAVLILLHLGNSQTVMAQDSLAFGDKEWIDGSLKGQIYFISAQTKFLPKFDTMDVQGTIYTRKVDIPPRNWNTGFPGVPGRKEWFGIVYSGSFKVKKPGKYIFRLLSDDGAKLYINKNLIIDNDGIHGPGSRLGEIELDDSKHSIKLEYFQGPQPEIALQLFATVDKENETIFSSDYFNFITAPKQNPMIKWLIYIGAGLVLILILYLWARRKRTMPTA